MKLIEYVTIGLVTLALQNSIKIALVFIFDINQDIIQTNNQKNFKLFE